jgi:hypothetical protein
MENRRVGTGAYPYAPAPVGATPRGCPPFLMVALPFLRDTIQMQLPCCPNR